MEAAQQLEQTHETAQKALTQTYATHDKRIKEMYVIAQLLEGFENFAFHKATDL